MKVYIDGAAMSEYQGGNLAGIDGCSRPADDAKTCCFGRSAGQRRRGQSTSRLAILLLVAAAGCAAAAPAKDVEEGSRFGGQMCVRPLKADSGVADCGPVEIALQPGNKADVRISDIVYQLQLHANQLDVVLMHGAMQIDGFSTRYDWQGKTLLFDDPEKGLSYEIRFDQASPASKR